MVLATTTYLAGSANDTLRETMAHQEERLVTLEDKVFKLQDKVKEKQKTIYELHQQIAQLNKPVVEGNNPGNIVKGNNWKGETQCQGRFECFSTPEYGIRAMVKVLYSYRFSHGLNTINGIMHRWAPTNENATENVINSIERISGIDRHQELNLNKKELVALISAIIKVEQGSQPYSNEIIEDAIKMAQ